MALQVWLPLNGNLKNKGLGKVTNNLTTGVVNDNGKFGKCYACKSGAYLSFNYTLETTSDFSLAFWVKVPSTITTAAAWQAMLSFSTNTGSDTTTPISWASYNQMKIYDDSAHQHAWLTIEYDTWLHFVITNRFSNGTNYAQIFKNGVLLGTYTSATELKIRSGLLALGSGINATYGPIYYNDVRIYDNCLNNIDAQELYWGKALEFTPQWVDNARIADASGLNFPLTPYNITVTGGEAKFNGSSSYIQFNGLNLKSGGTVSIWANLPAKPNVQRIYYCDPSSKMIVGYLAGGTILTAANSVSKPSYQSTGITWKNMHHIVAVYGNDRQPSALYVNGVQPATGTSSVWTNSGEIASIGRRIGSGGADYLSGSVNEVKVFSTQLTAAEAKKLYEKGPCENDWGHRSNIRLEYIESTGTQYIDTGYIPKSNTEIIIDAELTQADANVTIAGNHYLANASTISKRFHVGTYQSKWHFGVGNNSSWYNFPSPVPDTKRHIFRILADGNCYVDDKTYKLSPGTTVSNVSVGLFCVHGYIPSSNTHSYYQNAKAKIYRVTMKEGGVVVMDLVPVYYNGECYLLDLVSHEMKGNGGTGSFLGAAIPAV